MGSDSSDDAVRLCRSPDDVVKLWIRTRAAVATIDAGLVRYGPSGHPLVDVLLDVRNALARRS